MTKTEAKNLTILLSKPLSIGDNKETKELKLLREPEAGDAVQSGFPIKIEMDKTTGNEIFHPIPSAILIIVSQLTAIDVVFLKKMSTGDLNRCIAVIMPFFTD